MASAQYQDFIAGIFEVGLAGDAVEGDAVEGDEVGAKRRRRGAATPQGVLVASRKGRLWCVGIRLSAAVAANSTAPLSYNFTVAGHIVRASSWSSDLDIANLQIANENVTTGGNVFGLYTLHPMAPRQGVDPLEGIQIVNQALISGTVVNDTAVAQKFTLDIILWEGQLPSRDELRKMAGG